MAILKRHRTVWSGGGVVGAGVTTLYFGEAVSGVTNTVDTFWNAIRAYLPNDVMVTSESGGDLIESTTGALVGTWSDGAVSPTRIGAFSGVYARGVGVRVVWTTAGIVNGRRIRGTTFIVPFASTNFDGDGQVSSLASTEIGAAAQGIINSTSEGLVIWSRPRPGGDSGVSVAVTASVPRQPSWLRTRKT